MYIVLLRFTDNKSQATKFMDGHKQWIKSGFDEGVFLLAGSLQPNQGGTIIAHNITLPALETRVNDDPFVVENIVDVEFLEITPAMANEQLNFLVD